MLVTVNVYMPRLPLVLNWAIPVEPVVAVWVTVVPSGLRQATFTFTPETAALAASRTTTWPLTVTRLPMRVAERLMAVLRSVFAVESVTVMVTPALAVEPALSVTMSIAV